MNLVDVIKYEGNNDTFIWKHPCEDFNNMTQLIVHESQEAIFFMNGQAMDLFGPGRYTLETENIPMIGKAINRTTNSETPFHCEVYFINKTVQMGLKWGTDSWVRYIDTDSGIPLEIGASGEMNLAVSDSKKLLIKLVGTTKGISWEDTGSEFTKSLKNCFKPLISTTVKSNLVSAIKEEKINLLEIDEHLETLSERLREKVLPGLEEYGLTIPEFYLTNVVLPENDPNFKRMKELHTVSLQTRMAQAEGQIRSAKAQAEKEVTIAERQVELEKQQTQIEVSKKEAERKLIDAEAEAQAMKLAGFAEAEVMQAKGYNEKDVMQADVQKAFAEGLGSMGANSGSGSSTMGDIVGLGLGLQAANAMSGQLSGMFNSLDSSSNVTCPKCGNTLPSKAKFCLECGTKIEAVSNDEIICPQCGKKTVKGKFCLECGNALIAKCPNCNTEIPNHSKFCPECGNKF